jgi:phosphate transport system permease protein
MAGAKAKAVRRKFANGLFVAFCMIGAVIAVGVLALILYSLLTKGIGGLNLDVFTMTTPAPGSRGGLANAIVGSIMLCAFAMVLALVIGVLSGTWLAEYAGNGHYAKLIRFVNDILLSAPSILVGLFVYGIIVAPMHGFSGFAGAFALALLAIPVITRATEDVLKLQVPALRESGIALGTPIWITIRKILWRAASAGMVTGGLLAFARISGETAPLLFTSFGNQFFNWNMTKPVSSIPQVMYQFALSAYDDWQRLAWVGAILITFAVLATQIIARLVIRGNRGP